MATLTITVAKDDEYDFSHLMRKLVAMAKNTDESVTYSLVGDEHRPTGLTLSGPSGAIERTMGRIYATEKDVIDAAEGIQGYNYRQRVLASANQLVEYVKDGTIDDEDTFREYLDSESEVIYYSDADEILHFTDNESAYEDEMGEGATEDNKCIRASFALMRDIEDRLFDQGIRDYEALIEEHRPLTDDEKDEALQHVTDQMEEHDKAEYGPEEYAEMFGIAAESVTDNETRQAALLDYLHEYYATSP